MPRSTIDLAALRTRLAGKRGRTLWRSLEQVAETPEFSAFLHAEFPAAYTPAAGPDRRRFLQLMAASMALGGLAGCDDPPDGRAQEVPYVHDPERVIFSAPMHYASASLLDGIADGIVVTTRDGRPIKVEGNDRHPWSRGGTDVFAQASVLGLYDPERSQAVRHLGRIGNWAQFEGAMTGAFGLLRAQRGEGLRLLTGPLSAPSMLAQIAAMRQAFPAMRWHTHAAFDRSAAEAGSRAAFGAVLQPRWHFDRAELVVSLDGDMLDPGPHQVGVARDWIDARRALAQRGRLLRLFHAGPTPTLTSGRADDRLAVDQRDMPRLAAMLLAAAGGTAPAGGDPIAGWVERAASALAAVRGRGVVLAGMGQPAAVHEAAHRINAAFGNLGGPVSFTAPVLAAAEPFADLVRDAAAGRVDTLVMLETNPAHTAPAAAGFVDALARVRLKLHSGLYFDETAAHADWHLPATHPLESWGDARAFDGTVTLLQPTTRPFYQGRSAAELLSLLADPQPQTGRTLLFDHFRAGRDAAGFAPDWERMLSDGFVAGSALPEIAAPALLPPAAAVLAIRATGLDVVMRPDPSLWDGRFANNAWLQELPRPLSKLVWTSVLSVSPSLAEREGLHIGDVVALEADGRRLEGPVWVTPGQGPETITVTLGQGRRINGALCDGIGYDAAALLDPTAPATLHGVTLSKTGRHVDLVTTQNHHAMEGPEDFVRVQPVDAVRARDDSSFSQPTLYHRADAGDGRAWGMVIDLDACIGCNACVVACQSENNIPVVGAEQVAEGRDMHWLRVDRYHAGGLDDAGARFMPVPCMHCEQAPCEVGCPVEATLHDSEGLNLMVYNRCVGTRACSTYCPYKVRRFNYLDYTQDAAPSTRAGRNPDVTVRARGVMEKCTFCVQRVAEARIAADGENRPIRDGEVKTACQSACPTRAIVFGDLADHGSAVAAARADARNYALLGELNTRPRTTYLSALGPAAPG